MIVADRQLAMTTEQFRSGGVDLRAEQIGVSGDVVGRDKIVNNIQHIYERALTAAEEARQARSIEAEYLAQGVSAFARRLRERAGDTAGADKGGLYKGLLEYDMGDAAEFFGRTEATDAVLTCLARSPLTVLHADSGMGKTSLLKAGIEPRLLAYGHVPLYIRLYATSVPHALKGGLLTQFEQTPNLAAASLHDFLRQVTDLLRGQQLVVLLDQFEEVFTAQSAEARAEFASELAACLDDDLLPVRWVLALRSKWFGHLSTFQPPVRQPFANQYLLHAFSREEAREAIILSAQQSNLDYEPGLVEKLIDDLGPEKIAPPQLQLVCHALVERLAPGEKRLTIAGYERLHRADGILRDYLDNVLARNLLPADRTPAWRLLAAIAEQGIGRATEAELVARLRTYAVSAVDARRVLNLLETNHLVRLSDERYQLASESLLPRIRQWAAERAARELARVEAIRQLERVRNSALRGLLGGAIGFSLAYLITYMEQIGNKSFLVYITAFRALPGGLAGCLVILSIDVALATYHGPRRWMRWLMGGLAGAGSFALAVLFHAMLQSLINVDLLTLLRAAAEGAVWGVVAGVGTMWVMSHKRPLWQTLPGAVLASGLALWLADQFGHAFGAPPSSGLVLVAGAIMPFFVMAAALMTHVSHTGKLGEVRNEDP
jgi:hypothetical protein